MSWSELLLVVTASVILFGVLSFFAAGSTVLAVAYLTLGVATVGMVAAGAFIKAAPPWVHWVSDQALARRSWTVGLLLAVIGAGAGRLTPDNGGATSAVAPHGEAQEEHAPPSRGDAQAAQQAPTAATPKTAPPRPGGESAETYPGVYNGDGSYRSETCSPFEVRVARIVFRTLFDNPDLDEHVAFATAAKLLGVSAKTARDVYLKATEKCPSETAQR